VLGIFAILAALYYTMGKRAYGYSGWGDVFVLVFFGWVGVIGSSYLQINSLEPMLFLPATAVGFLAMGVLNLNNMRDIESDHAAGKNTLVVKIGLSKAKIYHIFLLSGAVVLHSIFVIKTKQSAFAFLYLLIIPLLFLNGVKAWKAKKASDFEPLLKPLAIATLLFCLLAGIGQNL
jgi:1,4-dihydroxy-2-naphthoate octaprenyltransferase